MQGTRGGQSGGAEDDEAGSTHERVKALKGKGKWEKREEKHEEDDWRERGRVEGERAVGEREQDGGCGFPS